MAFYVIISLCAFVITLLGTRVIILALRNRVQPLNIATLIGKERPLAPTGGGIAMIVAMMICLLVADIPFEPIIGVFMLTTTYQLHRLINIPAPIRFLVHVMAVFLALAPIHIVILGDALPPIADKILIAGIWLWFMKQFSAMDKLDGLCAVQAVAISGGLSLMAVFAGTFPDALSTYGMIISASAIAFIWWNWHPAKVRMGAVGNVPLGFLLGYLLLLAYQEGYTFALFVLPAYIIADGVITGTATLGGRVVAIMANDSTVKAGSWGRLTVEKILRIQETALKLRCPLLYLVDSAGARITDQIDALLERFDLRTSTTQRDIQRRLSLLISLPDEKLHHAMLQTTARDLASH